MNGYYITDDKNITEYCSECGALNYIPIEWYIVGESKGLAIDGLHICWYCIEIFVWSMSKETIDKILR